jgi:outer membrane receptor protein involved in Fe transport
VELARSVSTLDQVVVTGTVVATELKAIPNAITVITAKQIEERGITRIDQLFRGDVPGVFAQNKGSNVLVDEVTMFSRGATAFSSISAGTGSDIQTNPMKTYVDGVEMADPQYLSQIDPRSIERIEILTGPQASTIYGSNALNGVMQIFTKRGTTSYPQVTVSLQSGWVENNFSTAHTPQHDYSMQLSGVEGRFSYNAGGSWQYTGPWSPARQTTRIGSFGGTRLDLLTPAGRVTADFTLRRSNTQNLQHSSTLQGETGYQETGWYVPTSWWSHELGIGQDTEAGEWRRTARGYTSPSDTSVSLQQDYANRRSLRYVTTVQTALANFAHATITLGSDAWQSLTSNMYIFPETLTGSLGGSANVSRRPSHNAGGFLQTQIGVKDRLFVTYGLRAEWNPDFGKDAMPNYAPRYGMAYTQDVGTVTVKLRASYGRSTRPPKPSLKAAVPAPTLYGSSTWAQFSPYYDVFDLYLASPGLGPERQQGGEGGMEFYMGTRGSLVVTRYNQTIDGLIDSPRVDSVRTRAPCLSPCFATNYDADGYGYWSQVQYLNIGSIRNQGWELQGSLNTGPFTTKGTYSWTKSRSLGVDSKYRSRFDALNYPQHQVGAMFRFLPEHTWAVGVTYARSRATIGINMSGIGRVPNQTDDFALRNLNGAIRLTENRLALRARYFTVNAGYALVDMNTALRVSSHMEGILQIQNLADRYVNDYDARWATIGRQLKGGFRIR